MCSKKIKGNVREKIKRKNLKKIKNKFKINKLILYIILNLFNLFLLFDIKMK